MYIVIYRSKPLNPPIHIFFIYKQLNIDKSSITFWLDRCDQKIQGSCPGVRAHSARSGLLEAQGKFSSGSDNRLSVITQTYFNKKFTNHHRNGFVLLKIITHKPKHKNQQQIVFTTNFWAPFQSLEKAFIVVHLICINLIMHSKQQLKTHKAVYTSSCHNTTGYRS